MAAWFEAYRIWFVTGSITMLTVAAWLTFRQIEEHKCDVVGTCTLASTLWKRLGFLAVLTGGILMFPYLLTLVSPQAVQATQTAVPAHTKTVHIAISGMTCQGCAVNVQRALLGEKGVSHALVSYSDEAATIQFDSTTTNTTRLINAIRGKGFGTAPIRGPHTVPTPSEVESSEPKEKSQ